GRPPVRPRPPPFEPLFRGSDGRRLSPPDPRRGRRDMTSPSAAKSIRIVADAGSRSAFLPALCKRLAADGAVVSLDLRDGGGRGSALATLLSLEAMLLRRGRPCWCDRIGPADVAQWTAR